MSIKTSDIARRLAAREDVEPPEGLLDNIKAEIPPALYAVPEITPGTTPARPSERSGRLRLPRRRLWLLAASVATALCGGLLALRLIQFRPLAVSPLPKEEQPIPAPLRPPASPPASRRGPQAGPGAAAHSVEGQESERDGETVDRLGALGDTRSEPAQPVEVLRPMPAVPAPPPAAAEPKVTAAAEAPMALSEGVEGGVEGGVPGGVVGGVPGGVARNETVVSHDLPLRKKEALGRLDAETRQKAVAPSAGGTAEPNDQAYGDVFFRANGVNPFVDAEDDHLSTFGLDVETGSYTVARRDLGEGQLPPPESVRVEEFVNYFSYGDEPPARGDFALHAEGAPTPFAAGPAGNPYRVLRFNVRAREVTAANPGTLQTVAKDAKAQVDFNPSVVSRWRLLGYENRDIADDKLRDDSVDAGEIGAGHSVTALYEVKLRPAARGRIATLHLRFRADDTREIRETTEELRTEDLAPSWERATPGLRLASVVAELAEVLRGSYWAKDVDLDDLVRRTQRVTAEFVASRRAADILDLARMVETAVRLRRQEAGRRRE